MAESELEKRTQRVAKLKEKLAQQKELLVKFEKVPSYKGLASEMRSSVGITRHHLEDAELDLQKHTGGIV